MTISEIGGHDILHRRLELLVFIEENPSGWTFRAERFFMVNRIFEIEKLASAKICKEGMVLSCLQWRKVRVSFND